jgi:delta1-piperideine-2-carboxylate reductase
MSEKILQVSEIKTLASECLQHYGCDERNAEAVADVIARAERDGCHAHGLMRLAGYTNALKSGKVNGKAKPTIESIAPSVLRANGDQGYAPLALALAREPLIATARKQGIAALALTETHHFAALWGEVEPIARAGICALACVSYMPAVIPAGGSGPLYGTNPLAFGWPRADAPPLVFDQASSVVARGEVMLAAREGRELAPGIGVDSEGHPSNDPQAVLDGALLAFGGHKGSSIAMMIELFAGALIGECFSFEAAARDNKDGGPPLGGELIIAMDPSRFGDALGWASHAERLFEQIEAQNGARLPGDRRYRNRAQSMARGVAVPASVLSTIDALLQ